MKVVTLLDSVKTKGNTADPPTTILGSFYLTHMSQFYIATSTGRNFLLHRSPVLFHIRLNLTDRILMLQMELL